jgi:hypothetical protein
MTEPQFGPAGEPEDFQALFEVPLDLDEERTRERGEEAVIGDEEVRLLLRENRIGLAKGRTVPIQASGEADPNLAYYRVPLVCVAHPHHDCTFHEVRLMVDLGPTAGGLVRDMSPREVAGDAPVELETTVGAGVQFEIAGIPLGPEVSASHTRRRTVHYPKVVGSGIGFARCLWSFLDLAGEFLHVNRELQLLVSAPPGQHVVARFRLRAEVKMRGIAGWIPLLARNPEIEATYRLD